MAKTDENTAPVLAVQAWPSNAELIADVARCGYLDKNWTTLDVTYGEGVFWNIFRPRRLITHDLAIDGVDFRHLPERRNSVKVTVLDPPYALRGTPRLGEMDRRFGLDKPMKWQERHQMIKDGIEECIRVTRPGGFLLLKCQDQVAWHQVRWQTREFADHAELFRGVRLVDRFDMPGNGKGYRAQPAGRPQRHARRNASTLLVFQV